jgi:hypothetical protein
MLLIGVLLGRGSDDSNQSPPQVVTVSSETNGSSQTNGSAETNGSSAANESSANAPSANETSTPSSSGGETVPSDWPVGKDGWAVQLATLPKDGTSASDVEATRQSYSAEGVKDIGVLDTDLYPSLLPASYVIYSGVYDTRADAEAAVSKLGSKAPGAEVVEVSSQPADAGSSSPFGGALPGSTGAPEAEVK